MPNVVRFALSTAKTLYVPGAGTFVAGILDVDANNLAYLTRVRYLVQPYRAVELGTVDAATPKPTLPAVPGPPAPDPYPQYLTPAEAASSPELRAAFVAQGRGVPGRRLAMLGDSITSGALGASTPEPNNVLRSSPLMYACMMSQGRLEWAGQFGVPGETTAQIFARVGQVIAAAPDMCLVLGGTNDGAVGTVKTNLPKIVSALRAAGIEPVLATIPPSSSTNALTTDPHVAIRKINGWITKYATLNGLRLVDFFGALVDPAVGRYLSGHNADITHPTHKGYRVMGQVIANVLSANVKAGVSWLTQDVAEPSVFAGGDGGLFTSGTTLPAGAWAQSAGAAGAFVTDAFFLGRAYQIARANGDATSRVITNFLAAGASTAQVGDLLSFSCKVKTVGLEASGGVASLGVGFSGSSGAANLVSWQIGADVPAGGVVYYEATVPAGTTTIVVQLRVDGGNAAGDTVTIGQLGVRNLSRSFWP